nr:MAG TPA: hypothetical protein [Caudoviricetes sp.]
MALYKALKNITFSSLDKTVLDGDTIELEEEYANKVIETLSEVFPGEQALIKVAGVETEEAPEEAPKKATRKKKADEAEEDAS